MKKIIFLLFLSLPLVFAACSDDDDKDEPVKYPLENTVWEHTSSSMINVDGKPVEEKNVTTISFAKETYTWVEKMYYDNVEQTEDRYEYETTNYTYIAPAVTLNYKDEEGKATNAKGNINGNEMILGGDFILKKK